MRPAYTTPIHPPGTFQNNFTGSLFSFLYALLDGFALGSKSYTIGPYIIVQSVTQATTFYGGFNIKINHNRNGPILKFANFTMKMANFYVVIDIKKHCFDEFFEILPAAPFETTQRPPLNETCTICMDERAKCTITPC